MSLGAESRPVVAGGGVTPPVDLGQVVQRLESALMTLLTADQDTQSAQLLVVERLCAIGARDLDRGSAAAEVLASVAERALTISGLLRASDGEREHAFSQCCRALAGLRSRWEAGQC